MKTTRNILLVFFMLLTNCIALTGTAAAERIYLDITAPEVRKINFAVPWFVNKGFSSQQQSLGIELADTLAKSLKFHGIISIIPTSDYGGSQSADWRKLGADYVVLGQYSNSPKGLTQELRLLDVAGNAFLMGKKYTSSLQEKDKTVYRFCDEVIEELTGQRGIADTRIAFISYQRNAKEVYLTDILGRTLRKVTRHNNLTVSPRFTPDGNHLTYSSYHTGNQNLYITDLRQSRSTIALSRRNGMNLAPAWAPDGKTFILTLSNRGNPDLYRLDNRGNIIEQLTQNAGINVSPTYSPDGTRIAFTSDRSGKPQIYVMDLRTRQTQRITYQGSENAEPSWSPTEDLIAYSSLHEGVYQIFTVKPEQYATPSQVTTDLSHHESPCWSPDGKQIIFSKRDGKNNQIYAIMKNGSFQRRLFNLEGSHTSPRWAR